MEVVIEQLYLKILSLEFTFKGKRRMKQKMHHACTFKIMLQRLFILFYIDGLFLKMRDVKKKSG